MTDRSREISRGEWAAISPTRVVTVFGTTYAATWLAERDLKPRTRAHYAAVLDRLILPTFAGLPVRAITPALVWDWHARLGLDKLTLRSHAYGLLRAILATAVTDEELVANPCHLRGAGSSRRVHKIAPATLDELAALVREMPERYQAMTLLAAWCGCGSGNSPDSADRTST